MNSVNRRDFLKLVAGGSAWAAMARPQLSWGKDSALSGGKRKNVLFIAVDDLRPQLGCYGLKQVISPNIDRLAARGTLFTRTYCQQAVCSPSRTSLLTGFRPDTTKVYDLETHFRKTIPNAVTLPQHFKNNGYEVRGLGKIFHGSLNDPLSWSAPLWWFPENIPVYQSPENQALLQQKTAHLKDEDEKIAAYNKGQIRGAPVESADVPDNAYKDGAMTDEAIRTLSQIKDKPFFLAVGFLKPHLPFVAPKKYWDLYRREDITLADNPYPPKDFPPIAGTSWGELRAYSGIPKSGPLNDEQARSLIHGYLACVSYTDAQIGRLLEELDSLGLRDNTIVVLWGDHGWKLGEHGMWCKHTNFELDTRSPLICSVPGQKVTGQSCPALTEFVDIYPTLCELCGLSLPANLEGTSFVPLLNTPDRPWKKAVFSQYPRPRKDGKIMGYSMRTDRWRYTEWQKPDGSVTATELYDHQQDPAENTNIVHRQENAALLKDLAAQLKAGWKAARP